MFENSRNEWRDEEKKLNFCITNPWGRLTDHVLHGEQRVDVQQVPPPVFRTVHVLVGRRVEHGIELEPRHCHLDDAQDEEVRRGKAVKTYWDIFFSKVYLNRWIGRTGKIGIPAAPRTRWNWTRNRWFSSSCWCPLWPWFGSRGKTPRVRLKRKKKKHNLFWCKRSVTDGDGGNIRDRGMIRWIFCFFFF